VADTLAQTPTPEARPGLPIDKIRDYRLVEEIGSGGMAVVYKGVQQSLGREVAIKALKTSLSADPNVVARFEREALSVAACQHENLITLYDFFHERGALFMVMEYVEGIDLYDLLEKCPQVPADVVAIVALQIARALDYAHFRGIIHRDVKPANVILSKHGEVKLTDFGIARVQQSDLTETGIGLGTPAYMSPEQIVGDALDHRTDIWSLGVVCYQMLAGRKPFLDDEKGSALQKIRQQEPPALLSLNDQCPEELADIFYWCMKKPPDDRFGSAQELIIALEQYLAQHVKSNYRARLVMFLREQDVTTADETSALLHPALIGQYTSAQAALPKRQRRRGRSKVAWSLAFAMLLLGLVGGWAATIHLFPRLLHGPANATAHAPVAPAAPAEEIEPPGKLRILVHPWARVRIDGGDEFTTPFDEPVELSAGNHEVFLSNPYFEPETHVVQIASEQTTELTVALKRRASSEPDAGPADGATR
jgi:hypothetical protein